MVKQVDLNIAVLQVLHEQQVQLWIHDASSVVVADLTGKLETLHGEYDDEGDAQVLLQNTKIAVKFNAADVSDITVSDDGTAEIHLRWPCI